MSKLDQMSTFNLILLIAFGASAVGAVALFAIGGIGGGDGMRNIDLTLWGSMDRRIVEDWLDKNFEDNPNINVEYRYINENSFDMELVEEMSLERGPDMVLISQDQINRHRERLMAVPFNVYSERQFRDTFIQSAEVFLDRSKGSIYAFPVLVDSIVMYWNRSFVREMGYTRPPEKWGDLGDFVRAGTKRAGDRIERGSVAFGEYSNLEHAKGILSTLIFQAGGRVLTGELSDLSVVFENDFGRRVSPAVSSVMFFTDFSDPRRPIYTWNREMPNSFRAFTDEEVVVYFGKTSDYRRISETNPFLDLDVSSVPENEEGVSSSYANVIGLGIIKTTPDPQGCFHAAEVLTSRTSLEHLSSSLSGVPPAREDILNNPPQHSPQFPVFYRAAIRSQSWIDPAPSDTEEIFRDMIEAVVDGDTEVDDAVTRAHRRLRSLIRNL